MCLFTIILLLLNYLHPTFESLENGKMEVKVGALFFRDETEIELGFDEAFREINNIKTFELNFIAIKRYVPSDDSFILQQLTCELIASGVAAIFGPSSKASSDIVAVIANTTGIPHLQYDLSLENPRQDEWNHHMSINVAPYVPILSRAYWDIVRTDFRWQSFMIIYETEEGLARLQHLMDIKTLEDDFIKLRNIANYKDDYRVLWKEAKEIFHETRLILDCSPDSLKILLDAASEFDLLGAFKNWFFTNLDTHSSGLTDMYNEDFKANVTSVRIKLVDQNPYERKKSRPSKADLILGNQTMLPVLIYDAVILFANSARNIIMNQKSFKEPYRRCEILESMRPWYVGHQIADEMKTISEDDVQPGFKTENMKLNELGQRIEFNLEIYKPTVNEPLAIWTPSNVILPIKSPIEVKSSFSPQDFSVSRKMYTVVTHFEDPYFMLKPDYENLRGIDRYEGYAVDLINKLSQILDFDYEFMIVDGNGKYNPVTNQWDGIIGKLIEHRAQIGICDLTITHLRRRYVDFTVPFMQLGISILHFKKQPEQKDPFAFLDPFAKELWASMLLTQLVVTLLLAFMSRISHRDWQNPNPANPDPDELENIWDTFYSFWLMIGSIMGQGCEVLPRGTSMRILTGAWWFFALMIINTYTASLAAFLTKNKLQSSITSLNDLVEQNEVKFGTLDGGSTSLFFSESNDTEHQKAWTVMKSFTPSAFTSTNKEGVDRVRKGMGNYAFLMETTSMSYNIEHNCDLTSIGETIGEKHYGLAVPLGADYRSNLSVTLLELSEKGELYKLKERWWKKDKVPCETPHSVDGEELSIIELGGVFLVLAGGVVVSFVIGIIEFLYNVQHVAAEERVTPWEAFKSEIKFFFKVWIQRKPLHIKSSSSRSSTTTSRRSSGQSRLRSRVSTKAST